MNQKSAYARWKMKLEKAEKALSENASNENKFEVEWCKKHVEHFKSAMSVKSTDKRKLKGQKK